MIDGVPINRVSLPVLRASLAILPQSPTLFSGTIRSAASCSEPYHISHTFVEIEPPWRPAKKGDTGSTYISIPLRVLLANPALPVCFRVYSDRTWTRWASTQTRRSARLCR